MRLTKLTGQTSPSLSFFSPSTTSESYTNTSSSGRDSTMTQDMAWLQKGARFQLASQGPGLCRGWRARPGAGTFCPLASSPPTRSSARVSAPASPRDETPLRGLDGESGTAAAEEVQTGWASPSLRTHGTEFPCLWTLRLSASDFQPKVKPKYTYDCASAKSSSICQLRPGGPTQGSPHQTLQWHCGAQCAP